MLDREDCLRRMAKADAYLKSVEVDIANIEKYLKSPEELNE